MATKSANLYARIEPDIKEQAEGILSVLGIPASNAINMFYKQIILQRGLPFEVKIPAVHPVDMRTLSEAQLNAELEKGYVDMQEGHTKYIDRLDDMLENDNSYIRTRGLTLIAYNAKWDKDNKIIDRYLTHITDVKPITARQCIKRLPTIAKYKPELKNDII